MTKLAVIFSFIITTPFLASTKPSRITQQPLKNGYYTQTTLTPKIQLYTVDVSQLEEKLDQYRLVYGIGQVAHGIMYYSWNNTFPND